MSADKLEEIPRFDCSTKNMHGDTLVRRAASGLVVGSLSSLGTSHYFVANHGACLSKEEMRELADVLEQR